ncbi:MAG: hypothetical protein KAT17_03705 [Candidatus Aminicenantes bacterium]|nr:hypothetical protein [Candidatus Aminicenantes bacterium]
MKRLFSILILMLNINLFAPLIQQTNKPGNDNTSDMISQNILDIQEQETDEFGEDEEYLYDEHEIFSRKLFQKKLPPLSKKEKIIWAFRMSEPDLFL